MNSTNSPLETRTFTDMHLRFLEIRGNGLYGKWLFEITASERTENGLNPVRFKVEFLPKAFRYSRLGLLSAPPGEAPAAFCGAEIVVPESIATAFDVFIRSECMRRGIPMRRSKHGPQYLLHQLATLITNAEIRPAEHIINEIHAVIERFWQNPHFIYPVKGAQHQHHFGDAYLGRFFVKEGA